jgi:hypothetical protein
MRVLFAIAFFISTITAMDKGPLLKDIRIKIVMRRCEIEPGQVGFECAFDSFATVRQIKENIALKCQMSTDQIILRALPRATGLVASEILEEDALVSELTSRYSNRFLLEFKKK